MISSAGTKPMKMYDSVSLRRTRHSRRCFIVDEQPEREDQRAGDDARSPHGVDQLEPAATRRTTRRQHERDDLDHRAGDDRAPAERPREPSGGRALLATVRLRASRFGETGWRRVRHVVVLWSRASSLR